MAEQPNLFPPNPPDPIRPRREAAPPGGRIHWMARVEAIIRILVRLYLGMLVMALPWLPYWAQNNLFTYSPGLLALAGSGFFRGVFSGLGLLNIILAIVEAKNARELS